MSISPQIDTACSDRVAVQCAATRMADTNPRREAANSDGADAPNETDLAKIVLYPKHSLLNIKVASRRIGTRLSLLSWDVYTGVMRGWFPKINQVILIIVIADFVLITAFGFLPPIFAVFITQQIPGATVATVGFALTVYWMTKSILQLFVARFIDRMRGEIDDFYFMIVGGFLSSLVITLYYFASATWHIYLFGFLLGLGDAMLVPPFYAIFTRHIDKGKEGFEWALYSSFSLGAGSALGGALGGIFATVVGFRAMFPMIGMLSFLATVMMLFLKPYIAPRAFPGHPRIFIEQKPT